MPSDRRAVALGRLADSYRDALADEHLLDLERTVALLDVAVQEAARGAAEAEGADAVERMRELVDLAERLAKVQAAAWKVRLDASQVVRVVELDRVFTRLLDVLSEELPPDVRTRVLDRLERDVIARLPGEHAGTAREAGRR